MVNLTELNPCTLDSDFSDEIKDSVTDPDEDYDTPLDDFQTYILSISENTYTLDQLRTLTPENIKELTLEYTFQNIYKKET